MPQRGGFAEVSNAMAAARTVQCILCFWPCAADPPLPLSTQSGSSGSSGFGLRRLLLSVHDSVHREPDQKS